MLSRKHAAVIAAGVSFVGFLTASDAWANAATRFIFVAPYAAHLVEVEVVEATDSLVRCVVRRYLWGDRVDTMLVLRHDEVFLGTGLYLEVSKRYLVALDSSLVPVTQKHYDCGTINAVEVRNGSVGRSTYDGRSGRRSLVQVGIDIERARRDWLRRTAARRKRS